MNYMRFWKSKKGKELLDLIVFAGIVLFLVKVVFLLSYIPSGSMVPALNVGDLTISYRGAYIFQNPQSGDIILFDGEDNRIYVKRIIGVPGDVITFSEGKVYVNGFVLEEAYLPEGTRTISFVKSSFTVPDGNYFVMGDSSYRCSGCHSL